MSQAKYQQIATALRQQIENGDYPVNSVIPSEAALQKMLGVSRYTVRSAIAQLISEGYLRSEKGSGTYVERQWKAPVSSPQTKKIGVITTYLSDYIFPAIIRGIEQTLSERGYSLLLASTNNDYEQERKCLERMIEEGVQGLIIEPTKSNQYNPNLALYVRLHELEIPLVMINAGYEELTVPTIRVDDVQTGYLATRYLIEQQHQHLVFVTKIDDLQGKYRMKGFMQACEEAKQPLQSQDLFAYTTETREKTLDLLEEYLREQPSVSGIVCYNDQLAYRLLARLEKAGWRVPEDYSLIGNDAAAMRKTAQKQVTTFAHPKEQMGKDAANWIVTCIESKEAPDSILYAPVFVAGNSVKRN